MANFAELINGEKPVLVDFYADWCGPCKMMKPVFEALSKEIGDTAKILKVDVDKNPKASAKYKIQSIPTIILFKKGEIKWRHSGTAPLSQLKTVINQNL